MALIGCGAIAEQMHLPVLARHKTLRLTALVDRDVARVQRFAKGYSVPHVLDDASHLTRDLVDAAIIATPPAHHAPCAIDLMRKGIHVLVEKPMAMNLADAECMVAEAEQAGVVLSVGFFRRMFPSIWLLRSLVGSQWAGRPRSFHVAGGGMYNWSAVTLANMQRATAGGGALMDFGSHMIDLLFAVFDEPVTVKRYCDNSLGGIEADCTIDLSVSHAGQSVAGRIELARTRELGSFIRVECEQATLEFSVAERFGIRVTPRDGDLFDAASGRGRDFELKAIWTGDSLDEPWYATFNRQFDDWAAAIRDGREPVLSGRSALATSRVIDQCYQSPQSLVESWVSRGLEKHVAANNGVAHSQATIDGRMRMPMVHVAGRAKRVLVTGASGFIGCRVAELLRLREHCEVRAAVNNPANAARLARLDVEMIQADLSDVDSAPRLVRDCDAVIHCAIGTAYGEPRRIAAVTVGGTGRLADAALAAGVGRFVHVSSMSVYGNVAGRAALITESMPVAPGRHDSYGRSKAAAEREVFRVAKSGLSAVVVRPARVFGPFSRTFVIGPLRAIAAGQFAWQGSPDVPADLVYVDNVAEALLTVAFAAGDHVSGQAFNIGGGGDATWRDFYSFIGDQLGYDLASTPVMEPPPTTPRSFAGSVLSSPVRFMRGIKQVVTSPEFKLLGRRVLETDGVGTMPRAMLERLPAVERVVRKLVGADESPPGYAHASGSTGPTVAMGSSGARLSNDKLREQLGFMPPVAQTEALELTLDWIRYARIV